MGTISWCEEEVEKSGLADERLRRRLRVLLDSTSTPLFAKLLIENANPDKSRSRGTMPWATEAFRRRAGFQLS